MENTSSAMFTTVKKGLIKINNDRNVDTQLKVGEKYYMYLPKTDVLLHLRCYFVAIRAADLTILKMSQAGKCVHDSDDCTFGYQFENFDSVHFTSFSYREPCELYHEKDIYVSQIPIDSLFVEVA
jgi:hypothetical protein